MGQHLLESRDRPGPEQTAVAPSPGRPQPRGLSPRPGSAAAGAGRARGTHGSATQPRSSLRLGPGCTKEQTAPLAFASPMETASPGEWRGEEHCVPAQLSSVPSAFASPALNARSGVRAASSPGRAEQAPSEKKDPQTNKPAGFVCEQTVNCDGAPFNLQIQLSTEQQPRIDGAEQKNEYLFQGLTSYPQDTGYLVTYSGNIQGRLTQLSRGICSRLRFLEAVSELCHPAQGCSTADIGLGRGLGPGCLSWAQVGL